VGIDADGRERLVFIPGEVAVPPFPEWIQEDKAVASIAQRLGRFHEAAKTFVAPTDVEVSWSKELADPAGGTMVCHNDVCPENVVFREGRAVALLDFDFAAPGRVLWDLAGLANMSVPLDTPEDAAVWGRRQVDPFSRLRAVADGYGLGPGRDQFLRVIEERMSNGGAFVRQRVEKGEPAFVDMWERMGGAARYARRLGWFRANRQGLLSALG
jgi:thiamine kinase-like enzyme